MKNIKKIFTYMVVGALVMALLSISCSNEDTTGGGVDEDLVQTNSNHPPAGSYYYNGNTNNNSAHTVTHKDGSCTIAGIAAPINGSSLEYEITVKSWLNYPNSPNSNFNYVGTSYGGEYTITKPTSSIPLDSFSVIYNITNESIESVSLITTQDSKYYGTLNLKRVE